MNDLHKKLTQAIIMGENPKVLAKGFAKYVSDEAAKSIRAKKSRAENLIMTETAYFRSEGQRRCYKELDVEEFENCATLDSRTSEVCRDMDGTHFPVSEMQPGLNCPPFHNRCRTATCPYFNDEFTAAEVRAARAEDGSYYTVPADMTYREWRNSLTDSQRQELNLQTKAARNRSADKEQHERYKKVLGTKNVPKSLDEFQRLKYNDSEGWAELKEVYRNETKPHLQAQLVYTLPNGEKDFIPDKAVMSAVRTIAGAGSKKKLRVEDKLISEYGGAPGEWRKRVGKIESEKYIFDVHWYELNEKQYRTKLKNRSDKK